MALPLVPIAGAVVKYGAVALALYAVSRKVARGRIDQRAEDAMDALPEGLSGVHSPAREQVNGAARYRRILRLGEDGPGVEIDLALCGRLRFRRV